MPLSLQDLVLRFSPDQTALLLGAGASVPSGAPSVPQLIANLISRLDPSLSSQYPLSTLCEILEMDRGRRAVIDCLREQLDPISPKAGMLALAHHPWRAIYTTNYDYLVERAYSNAGKPLVTVASAYDFPLLDNSSSTPLYKIHGTINQDRCYGHHASVILTDGDYTEHLKYRKQLFEKMKADLDRGSLLIIGQSLSDQHLREMVRDVAHLQKEIGRVDRIVLLSFTPDEKLAHTYERQGIRVAFGGIDDLMDAFATKLPPPRGAHGVGVSGAHQYLTPDLLACTISVSDAASLVPRAEAVFAGREVGYGDIASNVTFGRVVEQDIISRVGLRHVATTLIGPAGVGKTTAVRRTAFALSKKGYYCWEHLPQFPLRVDSWLVVENALRTAGHKGVLVLDVVTRNQRQANDLARALARVPNRALTIIATAESNQWKPRIKAPQFLENGNPLSLSSLHRSELVGLLDLVESNEKIGRLASVDFRSKSRAQNLNDLSRRCGADMFVCMKNIFEHDSFDSIILREFAELHEDHRDIYRHVSALHAAGVDVHRQLIIRLLDIDINSLAATLDGLDGLIEEVDYSKHHGIYVWKVRHQAIAEIITKYKFADQDEFCGLLRRVIASINPAFNVELRAVSELCNSDFGIKAVRDAFVRIELYQALIEVAPTERVPRHRMIKELLDQGDVSGAEAAISAAINEVRLDPPLHRYRVMCMLARASAPGLLVEDRKALLARAHDEAKKGIATFADSKYSYFVMDDVARSYFDLTGDSSWLKESQDLLRKAFDELLDPDLERALRLSTSIRT